MQAPAPFPAPRSQLPHEFRVWSTIRIGLDVWGKNFVAFTTLALIVYAPYLMWFAAVLGSHGDPAVVHRFNRWAPLLRYVLNYVLSAVVTYGVVMHLDRRQVSLGAVIAKGLRRFLPAIVVGLVGIIAIGLATLALIIPGLIVFCMLYVAVPVAVVERRGVFGALGRSRDLTFGSKWRVLGLVFASFGVILVGAFVVGLWMGIIFHHPSQNVRTIVQTALQVLALGPLYSVFVATAYVILRRQKDGIATSEIAAVFE